MTRSRKNIDPRLKQLQYIWDVTKENIRRAKENQQVRPYWSEADLVHSLATKYQEALDEKVSNDLIVHVSATLTPKADLFGEDLVKKLRRYIMEYKKTGKKRVNKVIPDLIVHKTGDTNHVHVCAEVKLILGTNYWNNILQGVKDNLKRLSILENVGVCDEVVMVVAYDPYTPSPRKQKELTSLLDEWDGKLLILRYNC